MAILYKKELSHLVTNHQDGSERINVISIKCAPTPLCVINVYMPPQGSSDFRNNYSNHLDQLYEIAQKFADHIIIIGGDFNASILKPKYPQDHLLISFLEEVKLHLHPQYPQDNTFFSHNGSTRLIDYVICSHPGMIKVSAPLHLPSNTSSHCPVMAKVNITLDSKPSQPIDPPMSKRRINWRNADIAAYKSVVCNTTADMENKDIESLHNAITNCLLEAGETVAPPPKKTRRGNRFPISDKVKSQLQNCKSTYFNLKSSGINHPSTSSTMKAAKKALRKAIRIELARKRKQLYRDLMKAEVDKNTIFYKLVAKQRSTKRHTIRPLKVEGQIVNDKKGLLRAWASHFHHLGTQSSQPQFDQSHYVRITKMKKCIGEFIKITKPHKKAPPFTIEEVQKAVNRLNNNKAADQRGITAEHIKHAAPHILKPLASLFTQALQEGIQPDDFNTGFLTPVEKKGKDYLDPNNSRGIVISPILAKVYEHLLNLREESTDTTDPLQFGFIEGRSPTMASLITTEAVAEQLDLGSPVFIASLDTQKAFDVVWQDSLAVRLFLNKPQEYWQAHTKLLYDTKLVVRLGGEESEAFATDQGVGQGKVLSTKNYKEFIHPALSIYRRSSAGCFIGTTFVGAPTCADDVLLIANSMEDLQMLLAIAQEFANQERYTIHPQKTKVIIINYKGPDALHVWKLGDIPITPSPSLAHLGITRYASTIAGNDLINDRITTARRTGFGIIGAGLHGIGGINNACTKKIIDTYIIPRLLYGLESLVITTKQKELLDGFLRDLLKKVQALPQRTANEAPYLLLNTITAEGLLDIKLLTFFGKVVSDNTSILHQVGLRQLATKSLGSNSWFVSITKLAYKYDLPSPHTLLQTPVKQSTWKKLVKKKVSQYWLNKLQTSASEKPTLQRMSKERPTWTYVPLNTHAVARARIQTRLLTDTLTLQKHRSRFYKEDPTCRLCYRETEDVAHVLMRCPALAASRADKIQPILQRMQLIGDSPPRNDEELIQILLGFTSDEQLYNLGSIACHSLIHQRHALYPNG